MISEIFKPLVNFFTTTTTICSNVDDEYFSIFGIVFGISEGAILTSPLYGLAFMAYVMPCPRVYQFFRHRALKGPIISGFMGFMSFIVYIGIATTLPDPFFKIMLIAMIPIGLIVFLFDVRYLIQHKEDKLA